MKATRPLIILLTPGLGGPHAWARRLQARLTERPVLLVVRGLDPAERTERVLGFERTRELAALLREVGPATVFPNWLWNTYPALARLRARGHDLRVIAHCRSDDARSYYEPLARNLAHIDAIFSVSQRCHGRLQHLFPQESPRLYHVPTFVSRLDAPRAQGCRGPLRILYLGRVEDEHKRVSDLLPIASMLLDRAIDFELTIAGDGSHVSAVVSELGNLRHLGRVRLIGPVAACDVPDLLQTHDVMLQTSEVEGLSNSLLEGMAGGLVPVATSVGDTAAVVTHGHSGMLFEPGDVSAAVAALELLAADRDLRDLYGRRAWARTAEFSWEAIAPRLRVALTEVEDRK